MSNNTLDPSALNSMAGPSDWNRHQSVDGGFGQSAGTSAGPSGSQGQSQMKQKDLTRGDGGPQQAQSGSGKGMGVAEGGTNGQDDGAAHQRKESGPGDEKDVRVQLACFYCRNKRIRCSGEKPICTACSKASVLCEWPTGRRKKRTRKEMEDAKRLGDSAVDSGAEAGPSSKQPIKRSDSISHKSNVSGSDFPPAGPGQDTQGVGQGYDGGGLGDMGGSSGFNDLGNTPGFDSLFNIDGNGTYSADLSSAAFNPSDFWTFPAASSSNNPAQGLSSDAASSTNSNLGQPSVPSNYVWPTGFTPEMTLPAFPSALSADSNPPEPIMAQFMANGSPSTDMRLINALENQAAYIEGNPDEDKGLELFYYRFAGSTAIQPGITRISLKLQRRSNTGESPLTAAPQPERDETDPKPVGYIVPRNPSEMFDSNGMPTQFVWSTLFGLFLTNMSQHFPSVSRQRMTERFESGTMSNFLANCICACGARFSSDAKDRQAEASAPFIAKAQELIIPLIHLPTTETTTGLIFLAWSCFGQNSESGLWQYSGMAIRMAIDIGIHENSELYESPAHVTRTRLLFWTLFITDRIVAFATGRPASISEELVEIPLPEDKDFFPDPARNTAGYPLETIEPVPFVYFVRLMIICGRISNVLNGRRGRVRTLVSTAEPLAEQLAELQMRLVQFVAGLPDSLRWSADNFKHQHMRGHGGCFLAIHCWAHAVLALIYHPELLKSPSGVETPLNRSMSRNIKLSLASSRQICECMVFADLVAPSSYTSTPFLVQPLFVAAMAIIHEIRAVQVADSMSNASDMFLISMARQNLSALLNAISRMEQYWAGAGFVATILEKRSGVKATTHSGRKTLISLPDLGLLKRFTADKDDPRDLGPATMTSLRESMAKSERNNPSPYWLADLMAGYTVENMSFTPADSLDLERLLSGGIGGGFGMQGGAGGSGQQLDDRGPGQS